MPVKLGFTSYYVLFDYFMEADRIFSLVLLLFCLAYYLVEAVTALRLEGLDFADRGALV